MRTRSRRSLRGGCNIANNSLHEVAGAVDLAEAIGALDAGIAREVIELATRLKRMLRALGR